MSDNKKRGLGNISGVEISMGSNTDTSGLGTMAVGPVTIGSVDDINGKGGQELSEVVRRHELEQLADYWATERLERDFDLCLHQ